MAIQARILSRVLPGVLCASLIAGGVYAQEKKEYTMCVVHNNADHPAIAAIVRGMNDEAPHYGFKITYFDPAFNPQKQMAMIEDCITRKPDVIAVNPVDPGAVVPGLKRAFEAGIPVVMHNADTTEAGHAYTRTFVGLQAFEEGRIDGQQLVKMMGPKANIVILLGRVGQSDEVNRLAGFKAALAEAKVTDTIKILDAQPTDWDKDKALTVMQDFLTRYPNIDAVYSEDDTMSVGAMQAIKAAGRSSIKIFSSAGMKEACQAVKDKDLIVVTVAQSNYLEGVYTVRAAYDILNGRMISREILTPVEAITSDNIDKWLPNCW